MAREVILDNAVRTTLSAFIVDLEQGKENKRMMKKKNGSHTRTPFPLMVAASVSSAPSLPTPAPTLPLLTFCTSSSFFFPFLCFGFAMVVRSYFVTLLRFFTSPQLKF
jgi:hypothetical protein